jgi:hypothetical protein
MPYIRSNRRARITLSLTVAFAALTAIVVISHSSQAAAAPTAVPTYAPLNRPATSADVIRTPVTPQRLAAYVNLEPSKARVLNRSAARVEALVPTTDQRVCLVEMSTSEGAAISCAYPVEEDPALISYGNAVGVVPDGVDQVSYAMTDGSVVSRAVTGNLFVAPPEAKSATYDVEGQTRTVTLMPLSSKPQGVTVEADGTMKATG